MEQNPKTAKKTTWECVLSSEEKDYIIKAALFHDYSGIRIDRENPLLNALLKGDIGNAVKQSLFILANYKVITECHDVPTMHEGPVQDNAEILGVDELPTCTKPEFTRTPPHEDIFGGPPAPDEFTHWDGDGTERHDH